MSRLLLVARRGCDRTTARWSVRRRRCSGVGRRWVRIQHGGGWVDEVAAPVFGELVLVERAVQSVVLVAGALKAASLAVGCSLWVVEGY